MATTIQTEIELRRDGGTASIILRPPAGKPATLHHAVLDAIAEAVEALHADPPEVVVIRAAEPRFFCVGADVSALADLDASSVGPWVDRGHELFNRIADLPCPVIAAVRGYALGGGLELALACDLIVADASAKLGLTEASLGFVPGWGGCRRLAQRIGVARAKHWFFTGTIADPAAAHRAGLVDVLVDDDRDFDAALTALTDRITAQNRGSLTAFKRLVGGEESAARHLSRAGEREASVRCVGDPDNRARVAAFLEQRGKP